MYGMNWRGKFCRSGEIQQALADLPIADDDSEANNQRMRHLVAIENLEARGMMYANHDFDVLSGATSFIRRIERLDECGVPGCCAQAVFRPHENQNVRFCERHAEHLILATVAEALATE